MRRQAIAVLLSATGLSAQVVIDPARFPAVVRYFDPRPGETPLACEVTPVRPALNFSFRYQAGYVVRIPMRQFAGPGHRWNMVAEIVPEGGGKPTYFGMRTSLPDVPATRVSIEFAGGYELGEGRYRARWVMRDERQRACRKQWSINVRPHFAERHIKVDMPPNSVSEFTWERVLKPGRATADAAPRNLTILLDVAPVSPRRAQRAPGLRASDRLVLIALASAVLERVPARDVRLVAFNLYQQKEIFRRDSLAPGDLEQLQEALNAVELATVDYHILRNPRGYQDLLASLVNRELRDASSSTTVLFLGPAAPYADNVPAGKLASQAPDKRDGAVPRFYYFQFRPFPRVPVAYFPDVIDLLVARLKGKSFVIRTPADFEKAIQRLEQ